MLNKTLGDWRTHNGTDYAANPGESVYAVQSGEVTGVYDDALWGGVVEVTAANGVKWRYCGVADPRLAKGDTAGRGDELGTVADIPAEGEEKPHVHVECTKDDEYMDPEKEK
mgnify:CR=1 FL=1